MFLLYLAEWSIFYGKWLRGGFHCEARLAINFDKNSVIHASRPNFIHSWPNWMKVDLASLYIIRLQCCRSLFMATIPHVMMWRLPYCFHLEYLSQNLVALIWINSLQQSCGILRGIHYILMIEVWIEVHVVQHDTYCVPAIYIVLIVIICHACLNICMTVNTF